MKPLHKAIFSKIASFYYSQELLDAIGRAIVPMPEIKLLDAPCGTGALYNICMPCSYYGIDIDEDRVADCIQHFPEGRFSTANASNTHFPDAFFDIILAAGLFHHVDDQLAHEILEEFKRVLKNFGRIIIFDAIWPCNILNIVGWIGRKMDQGDFVRHSNEYIDIFTNHFKITSHTFHTRLGFDYIITELRKYNA
jgi:ubiquinone/menaquinone biosynthesis C-methylase UbiE